MLIGMGATGMDYIATVARYPLPDEKVRTTSSCVTGGGNCANTLTALARLGETCCP